MMKLWEKGYNVDKAIEEFTVGDDYILDHNLVYYDCVASIAHAKMLGKIKVLKKAEVIKLVKGLKEIIKLDKLGKFDIKKSDEDCHTAIENYLVKKLGVIGKKIHTARSRNDQVLVAMRLYEKDEIKIVMKLVKKLISVIESKIKDYENVKLPGYTHMQKAMPTTIKMWFSAYASSLKDDLELLDEAYETIDKNPLGSAAGFGVPVFKIDRKMTTKDLGFDSVQETMYAQNSRGKYESMIVNSLVQVMMSLNKVATDLIIFSMDEFSYFKLPKEFCTGSSIMPQKKNPDVLELLRGKYSEVLGYDSQLKNLYSNLISGYNRDMQLCKKPVMNSFNIVKDCLSIMGLVFNGLKVDKQKCKEGLTPEVYATEESYKLVKKGMSFRDAYKKVSEKFK